MTGAASRPCPAPPGAVAIRAAHRRVAPGRLTLPVLAAHAGPGIAVSDSETVIAMGLILRHLRLVVEPAAATTPAAALFHGAEIAGGAARPDILVLTGGNVDPGLLPRAVAAAARWEMRPNGQHGRRSQDEDEG